MTIHPFITHFPFILALLLAVVELVPNRFCSKEQQRWLYGMLAFFLFCAFFSGLTASESANRSFTVPDTPVSLHYQMARISFFLGLGVSGIGLFLLDHIRGDRILLLVFRLLHLILLITLGVAVVYGSSLTFNYGAGVTKQSVLSDQERQYRRDLPQ